MTKLDEFAKSVLCAWLASGSGLQIQDMPGIVAMAYAIAEAMVRESERRQGGAG